MRTKRKLGKIGAEKGLRAEDKVSQVSEAVGSPDCPEWFRGCRKANRKDEGRRIDFWFDTEDVGAIAVQVKSSKRGVRGALEKHPRIPVVLIPPGLSIQEVLKRCFSTVAQQRDLYLKARES